MSNDGPWGDQGQQPRGGGRQPGRAPLVALLALLAVIAAGTGAWFLSRGGDAQTAASVARSSPDGTRNAGGATTGDSPAAASEGSAAGAGQGLGTPIRDGDFEFTTSKVDCGRTQVGGSSSGLTAEGQYCVASVLVRNVGDEAKALSADNQFLYDGQNRRFATDASALAYVDSSDRVFGSTISPGQFLDGVVIFDVPRDSTPSRLEFHDSQFGDGSTLALPPGSVSRARPVSSVPPSAPAPAPPVAVPPVRPASEYYWTVVAASKSTEGAAQTVAAQLSASGYPAFVFSSTGVESLNGGYYVAATGQYRTSREAETQARQVRASGFARSDTYARCVGTVPPCPAP